MRLALVDGDNGVLLDEDGPGQGLSFTNMLISICITCAGRCLLEHPEPPLRKRVRLLCAGALVAHAKDETPPVLTMTCDYGGGFPPVPYSRDFRTIAHPEKDC